MAQVSNVDLQLTPQGEIVQAKISALFTFKGGEIGHKYRVTAHLYSDDPKDDDIGGTAAKPPKILFTLMSIKVLPPHLLPYDVIEPSSTQFKYERQAKIAKAILNEDPQTTPLKLKWGNALQMPTMDDIRLVIAIQPEETGQPSFTGSQGSDLEHVLL